jgi:hypothetical protein
LRHPDEAKKEFSMVTKRVSTSMILAVMAAATSIPVTSASGAPQAGAAAARDPKAVIWRAPLRVGRMNLAGGPGGVANSPKPPFTFVEEDTGGTNPKIKVRDARGVEWGVKWGEEVNSEVFASRIAWATGYFVEPTYFVPNGKISGVTKLDRAKDYVEADGSFTNARFELKEKGITKLGDEQSWRWDQNPFVGTKELNGLKIVLMLTSNWDSKDQRDAGRGSNTKIFLVKSRTGTEARYVFSDWGGTMGKWGGFLRRAKWDHKGFADQTKDFCKGVKGGQVEFGYSGQHTESIKAGISVADVQWLLTSLGKISDQQIRAALKASGASPEEEESFTQSMRARITQLQALR